MAYESEACTRMEPLELRANGFLPADAPDPGYLLDMTAERITGEPGQFLELAQQSAMVTECPQCGGRVPFASEAHLMPNGDEQWWTKPCPICGYTASITIVPKRAVTLRGRIERMRAKGIDSRTVVRYNRLTKMYRRIMARADRERPNAIGSTKPG